MNKYTKAELKENVLPLKKNGYTHARLDAKRDRKRREAEARNRSWQALTKSEKLESLADRRGESHRQIARLN